MLIELISSSFSGPGVEVKSTDTEFSLRKALHWSKISEASVGNYSCRAKNKETNDIDAIAYNLRVVKPEKPRITESNFEDGAVLNVEQTDAVNLTCEYTGIPRPKLQWYKYEDGVKKALEIDNPEHMCLENDRRMLRLKFTKNEDEGKFECEVKYDEFSDQRSVTIKISTEFMSLRVQTAYQTLL